MATHSPEWAPPEIEPGQLEYTEEQLLASHPVDEPLWAGDVLCHGGFVDGRYQSPRTLVRHAAIDAWKTRLAREGAPLVYLPRVYVPPQYPNYAQAKMLLQEGLREPVVRALTNMSIVEGFGAQIRNARGLDLGRYIVEDLGGTALAHLEHGLFEAHARDEAGFRKEGGHKQMWEAARDLALDRPEVPNDVVGRLLMRLDDNKRTSERQRIVPELPEKMESLIGLMANVMVIEVFAVDMFGWGQDLLGDPEVSADPKGAGDMIRFIESDEASHIEYLRTALSEIRARTLVTADGKAKLRGEEVVDKILRAKLESVSADRPRQQRAQFRQEIHDMLGALASPGELRRRFDSLDSDWTFPDEPVDLVLRVHPIA